MRTVSPACALLRLIICRRATVALALTFLVAPFTTCAASGGSIAVLAHAELERSVPADGQQLATAPHQVDLYFGQQLVQNRAGTFAVVLSDVGQAVSDESRLDPRDGKHVIATLHGSLDAGRYTVFWKTTSDEDGGVTLGSFSFDVGQAGVAPAQPGGQVLIPDDLRSRSLTAVVKQGGGNGGLAVGLGAGGAAGFALGASGAYLLGRRMSRRATPGAATRPSRGRRR